MRCSSLCAGCGLLPFAVVVDECVSLCVVRDLVTAVAGCGLLVFRVVSVLLLVGLVCAFVGFCCVALFEVRCALLSTGVVCGWLFIVCCVCSCNGCLLFGVCCGVLLRVGS